MAEFIKLASNIVPSGAQLVNLTAPDGTKIRAATFKRDDARATVVLLTGWSEFIEKYFEVISDLHARNFSVVAMDWRGQGLSERYGSDRRRGHIDDFISYADDITMLSDEATRRGFPGPQLLMSHSMGGAPALQLLARGDRRFAAAVLCAPMTQIFPNLLVRRVVHLLSSAAVFAGAKYAGAGPARGAGETFEDNPLTSDRTRYQRFIELKGAYPDATIEAPSLGWVRAASIAISDLHRPTYFERLATPVLILSAGVDALVSSLDHVKIAARNPLISRILIDDARHEIMMERDELRDRYWLAFDEFVEAALARNQTKAAPVRTP